MKGRDRTAQRTPTRAGGEGSTESIEEAANVAAGRMRTAGFDIGDRVEVVVDPRLPIMGYTVSGEGGRFRIVVSGNALKSGLIDGLLVHEMSHIYRMVTKHPSHNPRIIEEATNRATAGVVLKDYQWKTLHDLVNNIEDLYADDIAFEVIRRSGILTAGQASEFLQNWVEDEVAEGSVGTRAQWANAWRLANNARAIAQMTRHHVEDTDGRAATFNARLLSHLGPGANGDFEYFRALLTGLREKITPDEYRDLLVAYLTRFERLAEGLGPARSKAETGKA